MNAIPKPLVQPEPPDIQRITGRKLAKIIATMRRKASQKPSMRGNEGSPSTGF